VLVELTAETLPVLADQAVVLTTNLVLQADQLPLVKEMLAVIRQPPLELEAAAVVLARQAETVSPVPLRRALEGLAFNRRLPDLLSTMLVAVVADCKLVTPVAPVLAGMAAAERALLRLEGRELLARQIPAAVVAEAGILVQEALADQAL
jgi:hypothetical protein